MELQLEQRSAAWYDARKVQLGGPVQVAVDTAVMFYVT
jgi:hypothetical protein